MGLFPRRGGGDTSSPQSGGAQGCRGEIEALWGDPPPTAQCPQ